MNSGGNIGASGGGGGGGGSKWRAPSEEVLTIGDKRKNKVRTILFFIFNMQLHILSESLYDT